MSYTEHPDIDAARHMEEEECKALELEWLIEEESNKECYNPLLLENIVQALCNLSDEDTEDLEDELGLLGITDDCIRKWSRTKDCMDSIIRLSEAYQEKRIRENVMKEKW